MVSVSTETGDDAKNPLTAASSDSNHDSVGVFASRQLFVGREKELERLLTLRRKLVAGNSQSMEGNASTGNDKSFHSQVAFVHGVSGSGKTSLCRRLMKTDEAEPRSTPSEQQQTNNDNAHQSEEEKSLFFVEGKFDQYASLSLPYSAIVQAFASLRQQMENKNASNDDNDKSDADAITDAFKELWSFIDENESDSQNNKTKGMSSAQESMGVAPQRVAVALIAFLKLFLAANDNNSSEKGNNKNAIILFLDDLQWADSNSRDVLTTILNDTSTPALANLLFVGGYRDQEDTQQAHDEGRRVIREFRAALTQRPIDEDISLQNLSQQSVTKIVSHLMNMDVVDHPKITELGEVAFRKTNGNPFFVLQWMDVLYHKKALQYDFLNVRWQWDIDHVISSTDVSDSVARFVSEKIHQLPNNVQILLELASCLGFQIDMNLLQNVYDVSSQIYGEVRPDETIDSSISFAEAIDIAKSENLIEINSTTITSLKFSHDRIRQQVYEQINDKQHPIGDSAELPTTTEVLHYNIGRHLRNIYGSTSDSPFLLLTADQYNRGSGMIGKSGDDEERWVLIQLNVEAGKVARARSADELTCSFLRKAVALTNLNDWRDDDKYDLVLDLYNLLANAEASRGNEGESSRLIMVIQQHARTPRDTAFGLTIQGRQLYYHHQFHQSVKKSRQALKTLGFPFPSTNILNMAKDFIRVGRLANGISDEEVLRLPRMTDKNALDAVKILVLLVVIGFQLQNELFPMAQCRLMELLIRYGFYDGAIQALSGYAISVSELGNVKGFKRIANLALKAESAFGQASPNDTVMFLIYCFHLKHPLANALEPALKGWRKGVQTGDLFYGGICLITYQWYYMLSGLPLGPLLADSQNFMSQLYLFKQQNNVLWFSVMAQFARILMDPRSGDYKQMTWEGIEATGDLPPDGDIKVYESMSGNLLLLYFRAWISFLMGDLDEATIPVLKLLSLGKKQIRFPGNEHVVNYLFTLLDGLLGFALYQKTKQRKFLRMAKRAIAWKLAATSLNSVGLQQLLEAQQSSIDAGEQKETTKSLYDRAIVSLVRSGCLHYGAMAKEEAGKFMLLHGDEFWAKEYLSSALTMYSEWGARLKVSQMKATYEFLQSEPQEKVTGSRLRGRERFKSAVAFPAKEQDDLAVSG